MTHSNNKPTQLSFLVPHFSEVVRTKNHNNETYYSLVDIAGYYYGSKRAKRHWSDTKRLLQRENFEMYDSIVPLKLEADDGKMYETDMANRETCLAILISIPTPRDAEKRKLLAKLKKDMAVVYEKHLKSKEAQGRERELTKLEKAGFGQHPEVLRLKDRHTNIEVFESLKHTINTLCDNPQWGKIINAEYSALFGFITSELKTILDTKSVRDSLPSVPMTWLTASERTLQGVLGNYDELTNEQIIMQIELTIKPIGDMLKQIMNAQGLDHITGQPLLESGE